MPRLKEPHLAGRDYPASAEALGACVRGLLAAAGAPRPRLRGILVPHGPYARAGAIAAAGFAAAAGTRWRRAIILAPAHFGRFAGAVLLPLEGYRTPLGAVPIDAAVARLAHPPLLRPNPAAFMREPGIESALPFLQTVAPGCAIVPVLLGTLEPEAVTALADVLRALATEPDTLLVASSDLVHYGRRFGYLPVPPSDRTAVEGAVRRLDDEALGRLMSADAGGFGRWVAETGATICGHAAIEILLRLLPPGSRGTLLAAGTSSEATGEYDSVIGYASVAFAP